MEKNHKIKIRIEDKVVEAVLPKQIQEELKFYHEKYSPEIISAIYSKPKEGDLMYTIISQNGSRIIDSNFLPEANYNSLSTETIFKMFRKRFEDLYYPKKSRSWKNWFYRNKKSPVYLEYNLDN